VWYIIKHNTHNTLHRHRHRQRHKMHMSVSIHIYRRTGLLST
jgi:hypothetical protein